MVAGIIILLPVVLSAGGSSLSEFYYFNPDSPQSNLSRLKREMDSFFSQIDYPIAFQPFARLFDFDQKLKEKRPAFIFLPEWYLQKYGNELQLRPFLVPVRKTKCSYHKVLLVAKHSDINLKNLKNHSLAMTSLGPEGETILNKILFSDHGIDARELNTVVVPKDSDALFALVLGQVDMALVVKDNMEQIAMINPRILQTVRSLVESTPIPMPVLCYSEGAASPVEIQKIKEIFVNADKKEMRVKIMRMLNIDEWQTYPN